jgi:succinate-semialdehyde dehydrogenase / glutarate-semialdehyde dehydrogenase
MAIASVNPLNNQTVKQFNALSDKEILFALKKSEKAFDEWKETSFEQRSTLLRECARLLREDKVYYASLMVTEVGKVIKEAIAEIEKCALACEYYADNGAGFLKDELIETDAEKSMIVYQPLGTILAIMPWNFPFWQVFRFAAPTLMAGNVGILKHASNVPQCAVAIEEVLLKAGFPDGVFQNLLVPASQVEDIIANPTIKAVTITGSEGAGSKVAATAGKHIKKTVLELGGSDPFVVLEDADLDEAAQVAVKSRMINTGQSCIAAKRFIVAEPVAEAFTQKMKQHMEALTLGDPSQKETDYGPMAREDLADELLDQVNRSVQMGAKIELGGKRPDREGAFFEATLLSNVTHGMPAFDEEMFGPVAAVIIAKDEEDAISLANQSRYGLGGSVWTKDKQRGERVARQIESGAVFVNELCKSDPRVPFGGVKASGYGRELSYLGIREFVNQKTIWIK